MEAELTDGTDNRPGKAPVTALVVEDDRMHRQAICRLLEGDNFVAYRTSKILQSDNLEDALECSSGEPVNVAVIDYHFPASPGYKPEHNGLKLCKELRRRDHTFPIMIVTGEALSADDEANCLYGGANDYLRKPFDDHVFLSRLESLLRQHERAGQAELRIGPWLLCPERQQLVQQSLHENLTKKEMHLLLTLYRARGLTVPRPELLSEIWNFGSAIKSHTLETHIYRLRKKLEKDPKHPGYLETCAGGYRLRFGPPN